MDIAASPPSQARPAALDTLLSSPDQPTRSNATLVRIQVPAASAADNAFTRRLVAQVAALARSAREASPDGSLPALEAHVAGMPAFLLAAQEGRVERSPKEEYFAS